LEPIVSGILVGLIIVENVIAVDSPPAGNPLMEFLVNDALLGQLIVELLLSGDLELGVHPLALIIVVLVVVIVMAAMTACTPHWLVGQCVEVADDERRTFMLPGEQHECLGVHICNINYNYIAIINKVI
jgi:hypothetical protein